ncbi:MAG: caspase family protein, partial [Cyclobacteriaceae bacterium]|nr:caspase family protein [Cyclobacteriaceae bacterium]
TGKPKYQYSFDFNTFSVKKDPGIPRNALSTPKDVKETNDPYVLQLPRGKSIMNNDFEDGIIRSWAVTTDNRILVGSDFSLKMYDMNGNLTREFLGHTGGIYSLAISPDGRYFASGSDDQTIKLWKFDETGHAPSLLQYFEGEDDVLAILNETESDAVLREESRSAWQQVINKSKDSGNNKLARFLQEEFNNIGENIIPFASLFLTEDLEWVCWVPTGYFACSTNGADYFGWHLNNGIEELATFYSADQYFELLYRPVTLNKSIVQAKRVKEILSDEGEIIFDLSKLSRPSAGFFDTNNLTIGENKVLDYENGKYNTTINQLPLTVDIYDGGGGIREVNIYHNGKLLIHDTEVKSIRQNANFKKTYPVNLVNETNNFKVVVVNYQRIESRPDYLKIEYIGEQIITATLHVLSIGINQYQKEEYNLNYAYSDAQSFTDKIIGNSKSIFKGVRSKIELYDQQATRENIIKGFESIIAVAKPEDMFVFYYAGHGTIDEETNEYYLVPTNITQLYGDAQQLKEKGISASELKQMLANVKSTKQLILMDACHSGAAVEAFKAKDEGKKERAITNLARSSGVAMLTSSNSQQFATEFDSLKHGVFTYSLLEALDGKADTGDDQVSVYELKLYMERVVPILSKQFGGVRQRPIAHVFGNDFPVSVITKKEEVEEGDDGGR